MKQIMIMYGNPADGFQLVGPVTPNEETAEMITEHLHRDTWWYVYFATPEQFILDVKDNPRWAEK
jgi:hypothetical protein